MTGVPMLRTLGFIGALVAAAGTAMIATATTTTAVQAPAAGAVAGPLEDVQETLQRASTALSHAANQSCEVKKARADIKEAVAAVNASARFLAVHADALRLPPLPPAVTPDFTAPPRPAPQRNAMLEGALKNLKTAFRGLSDAPGGDLGGSRDKAYHIWPPGRRQPLRPSPTIRGWCRPAR